MSPEDTTFLPEDTMPESDAEEELIIVDMWEEGPEPQPAPFIAGSFDAEDLRANLSAVAVADASDMQANLSAVGLAKADWFESIGSVIGAAIIDGDAEISTSAVPLLIAKGDAGFHQAYASAVVAGGAVNVRQAGSPLMIAKKLKIEQGGAAVMVAGKAKIKRGFVGVLFARDAQISENSRVFVTGKSAALISAAVFGGLIIAAFAVMHGVTGMKQGHHRR